MSIGRDSADGVVADLCLKVKQAHYGEFPQQKKTRGGCLVLSARYLMLLHICPTIFPTQGLSARHVV